MVIYENSGSHTLTINQTHLRTVWNEISESDSFLDSSYADFESIFRQIAPTSPFEIRYVKLLRFEPQSWEIKLSEGLFKSTVMMGLLTLVLKSLGETNIPLNVLVVVIPMLFDIKKVSLSEKEKKIYLDLVENPLASVHANSYEKLYSDYLSDDLRSQLNKLEFLDFLEKLNKMGLSERISKDKILIKEVGKYHIHFSFK